MKFVCERLAMVRLERVECITTVYEYPSPEFPHLPTFSIPSHLSPPPLHA